MAPGRRLRIQLLVVAATFALLWGELLLTADAEDPNTWAGVVTDTIVLAVASAFALLLVHQRERDPADRLNPHTVLAALGGALFGLLLFWTGAAVVLGATAFLLARGYRPQLAWTGAAIAVANALYFPVDVIVSFAPGLPG